MLHLTAGQWRYLLISQLLSAVVINFVINFGFGWLFFHTYEHVPLWQALTLNVLPTSIAMDLIPTTFFLVFFTSLIVSYQVHHHVCNGQIEPMPCPTPLCRLGSPRGFHPSLRLGIAFTLTLVPLTVLVFHWHGIDKLPPWDFIYFKSFYATALSALFTPFVVLRTMAEQPA